WNCGDPSNLNAVLNWAYASGSYNGTSLLARYGIRGDLVTKLLPPADQDQAFIVGADVCVDSACSATLRVYTSHLVYFDLDDRIVDSVIVQQSRNMLDWIATQPHADKNIIAGDLNAFEREPEIDFRCELAFDYRTPKQIRDAGYTDGWLTIHGT